jgi:diaminopimelate decarboxylase
MLQSRGSEIQPGISNLELETLFPMTARVNDENHLEIGGCDVVALAREFGTPLYVFDDQHLRTRAQQVHQSFQARWPNSLVLYATKAYFSPYLARLFKEAGLGIDVTSEGELEIARRVDYPRDRIYLHGNNKTPAEIRAALGMGVEHIVVDNLDEIELLARLAAEVDATPRVLLRLAPAIDPHTHRYLATGVAESKFGLPLATGDALQAARLVHAYAPRLRLAGLHVHIGSQIFQLDPYRDAIAALLDFARTLSETMGVELEEFDIGGGWGVAYKGGEQSLPVDTVADAIVSALVDRGPMSTGRRPMAGGARLLVEPGRALVAQSAVALYTVGGIKRIGDLRTYVSVDGGMGDNIRPALYSAQYTACVANKMGDAPKMQVAIAGRYCEQGDILIEKVELPKVAVGDVIAIPYAGAYHIPMASNYNMIPRPAVIAVREGEAKLIRRRETIEDMLAREST